MTVYASDALDPPNLPNWQRFGSLGWSRVVTRRRFASRGSTEMALTDLAMVG